MQRMEARFNRRFQYPYVFLNEVAFDDEFKAATSEVTQARTLYGLIPQDHWSLPDWLSEADFQQVSDPFTLSNNLQACAADLTRSI